MLIEKHVQHIYLELDIMITQTSYLLYIYRNKKYIPLRHIQDIVVEIISKSIMFIFVHGYQLENEMYIMI